MKKAEAPKPSLDLKSAPFTTSDPLPPPPPPRGDELLPDELNFVRVQMTKRYKKELEADQSVTWIHDRGRNNYQYYFGGSLL